MNKTAVHNRYTYPADVILVCLLYNISLFAVSGSCAGRKITSKRRGLLAAVSFAKAIELAETILAKEVKIPSATIAAVKNEMRQLLERANRDSAPQGGTSDELENNEIRQGETPEVQPHGSALPP
jgi:predicted metal-binding protein